MQWRWLVGTFLLLAAAAPGAARAAEQATSSTTLAPAAPTGPKAIDIPKIAAQAEDTVARMRTIEAAAGPLASVTAIAEALPDLEREVSEGTRETIRVLNRKPTLAALDGLLEPWSNVREQARTWVGVLTGRAEDLEGSLKRVDEVAARWTATQRAAPAAGVPEATLGRIEDTLALIGATRARVDARRREVLVLQDRAAQMLARADEILDQVQATRRSLLGQLFVRDGLPFWSLFAESEAWRSARDEAGQSIGGELPVVRLFARHHVTSIQLEALLLIALGLLFRAIRQRARRWTALDDSLVPRFRPADHPWAAAALLTLLVASQTPPNEPRALQAGVALVAMLPIIRLIADLAPPELVSVVWVVGIFRMIDLVRALLATVPLV